ncbi:MAG: NADH-quinone oxidoreductase subunit L [Bacteroidetes bacterium]|nr:MAG: NADH-quinone oxidoreductase subunit L [Bacteroidota bacterium]
MVSTLLPLTLALPLLGAAAIGFGGLAFPMLRRQATFLGGLATALVLGAFTLFVGAFLSYEKPTYFAFALDWLVVGEVSVPFRFQVDTLSLLMALIVTGIGGLIHLYSIGYMHEEPGAWRYFAFLNLFIFAMLVLVLADSLPVLFLGWEGVGACSYFLIGFWFGEEANARAAQKAFLMNRLGDLGLLAGLIWLFAERGSFDISTLRTGVYSGEVAMGVGLLLFLAATGKSAQIPLYTWLPDAMAGPTPVSALIHAATMVTAGVYLLARMDFLYNAAPEALPIVGGIAVATALLAGLIALAQYDIKKVLAYSTVSQLGFMFAAIGAGAYTVAIFHVFTHAFFKALLFLGSGSVIHATGTQDLRQMGGLRKAMPITGLTFWIGTLAIAGIPPLAGFFSKDEILAAVFARGASGEAVYYLYWVGLLGTAFLTALYMGRLTWLAFEGSYRGSGLPHESPAVMTIPLLGLAVGSVLAGFVGLPAWIGPSWIREHWLAAGVEERPLPPLSHTTEGLLMGLSVVLAVGGLALAGYFFGRRGLDAEAELARRLGRLHTALQQALQVDRLYETLFVQPYFVVADFFRTLLGAWVGKGAPTLVGQTLLRVGASLARLQAGYVPAYLAYIVGAGLLLLIWLRYL